MSVAIKVENLSKIYRLGEIGTGTISRDIERWFRTRVLKQEDPFLRIGETNDRASRGDSDIVYSLRDINFEIKQGYAVGIIGRNGAGKSTLLKILSRVTTPTTGRINIKGRVASLLEVGTGFHPELTGRENIYLNGTILGMRKREIDRKLDEIIDFSGVERYIDTPVKRYSSGMYVRLAFAVAAHLESEILIVDEVLAVGDAEFQKKCLGKMGEVSKGEGRTVLFVSHNMAAVRELCDVGILLEKSKVTTIAAIDSIVSKYLNFGSEIKLSSRISNSITDFKIVSDGCESDSLIPGSIVEFLITVEKISPFINPEIGIVIRSSLGENILGLNNNHFGIKFENLVEKQVTFSIKFFEFPLYQDGEYFISLFFGDDDIKYEICENIKKIYVSSFDIFKSGRKLDPNFNLIVSKHIEFARI